MRSRTRASPKRRSARGSRLASPVWVSRRIFLSCVVKLPMNQEPEDDLDQSTTSRGRNAASSGKYYQRYRQGTNVILLDPDVAKAFKDSESVNRALRLLLDLARQVVPQGR